MTACRDAHNHLHDARLAPHLDRIVADLAAVGVTRCVVNGTAEDDWPDVAALARRFPQLVHPSFGLHPWKIADRGRGWLGALRDRLDAFPGAGVGECGLDRWIQPHDLDDQCVVFRAQLDLATERDLPLTIHCLHAWGPLLEVLRDRPLPPRGFLLHSYGGSAELVDELVPLGAWFSFSGYFLDPCKKKARAAFCRVPADRLLVETDAPDMPLPAAWRRFALGDADRRPLNHPAHLPRVIDGLAALREDDPAELAAVLDVNFERFFGAERPTHP